jgi:hypothetical protein
MLILGIIAIEGVIFIPRGLLDPICSGAAAQAKTVQLAYS